ncbi:MAG: FAD:protein FMN transferase [Planctomycetales bacterium]|nr:FAD:protein FMN transferase [Planctomycetales bacterium]
MSTEPTPSRRDFFTGRAIQTEIERATARNGDEVLAACDADFIAKTIPMSGDTVRLGKVAMACDFDVILNPGPVSRLKAASAALDLVDQLEDQMSVYRPHTELSRLNRLAAGEDFPVEPRLFELLLLARRLADDTSGAFDPTAGPLVNLWRLCKQEHRIPKQTEIDKLRSVIGIDNVEFQTDRRSVGVPPSGGQPAEAGTPTVRFARQGVELNLNSIGKGYALDRAGEVLDAEKIEDWLLHGGHSSVLARGGHNGHAGWPIAIRNPLFPERHFATILLRDCGMSTSGSGVQYFRHRGQRYGHIIDPRTGWPVEGMLSVTVLAPTAAEADALSTAFFVLGVEKTIACCHNLREQQRDVSALILPPPQRGRKLEPINCGIADDQLFFHLP